MSISSRVVQLIPLLVVVLLSGCQRAPATEQEPRSAWGEIITIAAAEQADSPAIWPRGDGVAAAWVGGDAEGVYQAARLMTNEAVGRVDPLPLPPVYPHGQRLSPSAERDYLHLTWLDARYDDVEGGTRLWTVLLSPDLIPTRGAVQLSDIRAQRYTLIINDDGSLWAIYSGGLVSEPSLYAQYIDPLSRPRAERQIISNGDWPTAIRGNDGTTFLFWLRPSDLQVLVAQLTDDVPQFITPLIASPRLAPGDQLMDFEAGLDTERAYLLWNIQRLDGTNEVWMTSGTTDLRTWELPVRLQIEALASQPFTTSFNGGAANTTSAGAVPLRWAAVMPGQFEVLALAAQVGDWLCVVYLQRGEVVAAQQVVLLTSPLIWQPSLLTDRDRHLYLAWSQPTESGYANLQFTSTRPD
ncbi:MAG: hypothetical protein SF029_26160 [bacterium]|nr:hypothetical protein [bacterium]